MGKRIQNFQNLTKRLLAMLVATVPLLLFMTAVPEVHASGVPVTPSCAGQDLSFAPIESGLWSGVNLDTGSLYTVHGTKVTTSSNGVVCSIPDDSAAITNGLWTGVNLATGTVTIPNPYANVNPCSVSSPMCVTPTAPTPPATTTPQSPSVPPSTPMPTPTPLPYTPPTTMPMTPPPTMPPATQPPASTSSNGGPYAAMGDSVAAGLGLSGATGPTGCGQTTQGYPFIVAARMNMGLNNVSCSGATVGDTFTSQNSGSVSQPPQLDTAFAHGTPRLITVTAGANDAHWADFAALCLNSNCATSASTASANALLLAMQAKLLIMFQSIAARSGGSPPTVIMTGYYNPVSDQCAAKFNSVTSDEIRWMNAMVSSLNITIQGVVSIYSFARFVPVSFTGHDICSSSSWVQGLGSPAPFHPTAVGQQVIAQDVLSTLGK